MILMQTWSTIYSQGAKVKRAAIPCFIEQTKVLRKPNEIQSELNMKIKDLDCCI